MDQELSAAIAQRLHQRRTALRFSLQQLADRTGLSRSTLQRYETGAIHNIPLSSILALCRALQVTPQWLLGQANGTACPPPIARLAEAIAHRPDLAQLLDLACRCSPADVRRAIKILQALADEA